MAPVQQRWVERDTWLPWASRVRRDETRDVGGGEDGEATPPAPSAGDRDRACLQAFIRHRLGASYSACIIILILTEALLFPLDRQGH